MSRRDDLIKQLIRSDKFGQEKEQEQKFLMATADLILTDLINICINGFEKKGAGSLVINLLNDSTVYMNGDAIEIDYGWPNVQKTKRLLNSLEVCYKRLMK